MLYLALLAALAGLAVVLQTQFMGLMDQAVGTRESVFFTYAGGALLASVVMLLSRGGNLAGWRAAPPYAFTAGALGLVIVGVLGYVAPRLGVSKALAIVVASQFAISALVDHWGLLGFPRQSLDLSRALGIGCLVAGAWLVTR